MNRLAVINRAEPVTSHRGSSVRQQHNACIMQPNAPKRKVVIPPRTGSGMEMTHAPTFPRYPRVNSHMPQAMPALCSRVYGGGVARRGAGVVVRREGVPSLQRGADSAGSRPAALPGRISHLRGDGSEADNTVVLGEGGERQRAGEAGEDAGDGIVEERSLQQKRIKCESTER